MFLLLSQESNSLIIVLPGYWYVMDESLPYSLDCLKVPIFMFSG